MTDRFAHLAVGLERLDREGLRRFRDAPADTSSAPGAVRAALAMCSNDYLGYAALESESESASSRWGAGASRLVSGTHAEHTALEADLAEWLGQEDALVFSSGYAANVGLLSSVASAGDVIVSDALNHASIIDGCRLSRAEVEVVPHADTAAVARALSARPGARKLVATEGLFSMDADIPDLVALRRLTIEHGSPLLVDEAHSLGVLGPEGRGACAAVGVIPDAIVGTFGKALGAQGAFVAGPRVLTDWLWNRARSFVFSTALSPRVAAQVRASLARARRDDSGRARVLSMAGHLRSALRALGFDVPRASSGPIIPVILGSEPGALSLSRDLLERGVHVSAIRPPTVPLGTSRLRVTVHAALREEDLARVISAFAECARCRR